jgi:hypothetical protein
MGREPDSIFHSVLGGSTPKEVQSSYLRLLPSDDLIEILLEPFGGRKAYVLDKDTLLRLLDASHVSDLDYFLWLAVPRDIFHRLSNGKQRRELEHTLIRSGVARVWPNLPLEPQTSTSASPLRDKLMDAFHSIGHIPGGPDGSGIKWAVVDTDVWSSHPVFAGHPIQRYTVGKTGVVVPTKPFDRVSDHGTHVTGILHAVAPGARIYTLGLPFTSVRDETPPIRLADTGHLAKALDWARHNRVDGINISLGMPPQFQDPFVGHGPGCREVSACASENQIVVVAAGNHGQRDSGFREVSISDPANARGALVVGGCHTRDPRAEGVWSHSSHGPTADGREKPDLVAPAVEIESCSSDPNSLYFTQSGTSQAAAFVSAACAILLSSRTPAPSSRRVIAALKSSAKSLGRLPTYQGRGLLRIDRALARLAKVSGGQE